MSLEKKTEFVCFKCNKCGYESEITLLGKCLNCGSFDITEIIKVWYSKESIISMITNFIILSERLNVFGAEFDNKMKSKLRKENKEEPTCLVAVYLRELRKKFERLGK